MRSKPSLALAGEAVFGESMRRLQQDGRIESFEVVLLYPDGFALLRGTHDDKFFAADDASGLITEQLGVVRTAVGESLEQQIARFQDAVG